jgi:hypothetical protein
MGFPGWVLALVSAAAAALLLNAGIAKLVSVGQPARAVAELLPALPGGAAHRLVRGFAASEIVVAVALLIAPARRGAAVAALALGLCFVALGAAGRIRSTSMACGCLGESGGRPLGWVNVGYGVAIGMVAPCAMLLRPSAGGGNTAAGLLLGSACSMLLCLWLNRRFVAGALTGAQARMPRRRAALAGK